MVERLHAEGEIGFFGKPRNGHGAPSQKLVDATMPGDHDKDNSGEQ
jgi:cytochrome c oxidase subunit 1